MHTQIDSWQITIISIFDRIEVSETLVKHVLRFLCITYFKDGEKTIWLKDDSQRDPTTVSQIDWTKVSTSFPQSSVLLTLNVWFQWSYKCQTGG